LYCTIAKSLKYQILTAGVLHLFLNILADDDMGFTDITCTNLLTHMKATYGIIETEETEANHSQLSFNWTSANPIKDLWICICNIQHYAIARNEPIPNATVLCLTLFLFVTERWHKK
jgi:hypothetical protein